MSQLLSHAVYIYLFTTFYITVYLLISAVPVYSLDLIHPLIRLPHNLNPHFFLILLEGESHCQRLLCCNCCAHGNKALEPQRCRCAAPLRFPPAPFRFYAVIKKKNQRALKWTSHYASTLQEQREGKKREKLKRQEQIFFSFLSHPLAGGQSC